MKVKALIALTAVVSLVQAQNLHELLNEQHEKTLKAENESFKPTRMYDYFTVPWAYPDFFMGLAMGTYGGLNARTRDGDCFSMWYDWGNAVIELSNYFSRPFDVKDWQTWLGVVIKSGTTGVITVFTVTTCISDLSDAKEEHWNHNFGFMADDVAVPRVRDAWTSEDTSWTISMVVSLLLGALAIYDYIPRKYYYWGLGMQLGYFASRLFVAIDYWADTGVMKPEDAHIRYLPADH